MKAKLTKILCLVLAVLTVLSLASCGTKTDGPVSPDTEENLPQDQTTPENENTPDEEAEKPDDEQNTGTHVVVDHGGNEVEVPYEVNRVVVCDIYPLPSVLTVFFDSADKIVGMAQPSMTAAANGLLGELYPDILKSETGFRNG